MPGPVFVLPPPPREWDESSLSLVRIIDPLGDAIAWFAPDAGGACAGYAVRQRAGSAPADPAWRWVLTGSRSTPAAVIRNPGGGTTEARWWLVSRDPASCTLEWRPSGVPGEHWEMTASLQDAHLSLVVRVRNVGMAPIQAGLHVRLVLTSLPGVATHDPGTLAVGATPGTATLRTNSIGAEVVCTVADNPEPGDSPDIPPDGFRQLTVVIGPGQEG